jgi:MFS family permease
MSEVDVVSPTHNRKPSRNVNEQQIADEWQRALRNSHITVWDGYVAARNNETGEFRLVEKARSPSNDLSPTSPDSFNEKGFNVSYPPPSLSNSDGTAPPPPPQPELRMSRIREIAFVINVCLAQLLSLGGLSQTIAPGYIIGTHLGADYAKLSLATAAYGMALGTLILPAGRLGDMFGHKRIFILGWWWFAVWSVFCGFSDYRGFTMLVGGRAMQGMGPALVIPNGLALIGRTFPMGLKRNFSMSCFGGMGPVGMVIGSAFSSLCAEEGWWQWSFWALGIACALISILSLFIVPADSKRPTPAINTGPKPKWWVKFDLPGALTGVAGLVLINFAFNEAPIVGWQKSYISFILVLGLICFGIFVYIELRVASHPLIPIKGLDRDAAYTLVIIACGWGR